jgi:predicted dehydrogenase
MNRRTFLVGSSMALPMLGANEKVNIAVIGLGGRGKAHINYLLQIPSAVIGAVCDVNQEQTERAQAQIEKATGRKPAAFEDMRKLFADKSVEAVTTATPNHWHSLAAIWAMQAGKDVYGEKPASYNMFEGRQMLATARKYKRICQVGMQSRSIPHKRKAIELLRQGVIGKVYMAKGLCFKRRPSINKTPPSPVPAGLNWDLFLGPAPMRPFTKNRFAYNWHWFWDTGNGDIGNQGIHEMDIARWGMGRTLPKGVVSTGGKYLYDDDQETPNTQIATFDFGDAELVFEVRGLITGGEAEMHGTRQGFVGNLFYGEKGYMVLDHTGYEVFLGEGKEKGESGKVERVPDTVPHMANFLEAVKSRNYKTLNGDVEEGVTSADLVHMANISYRLGRKLNFDAKTRSFVNDREANAMKTRPQYRAPYVVPANV